ncbi:MAG: hypothetical protein D6712_00195 [Chloroflexi bacterium]|nr:MAG: hypothetical protein D6712_00195 [Chloroflexota bacterium]
MRQSYEALTGRRRNLRLVLLFITLATIPFYVIGVGLLLFAPDPNAPQALATFTPTATVIRNEQTPATVTPFPTFTPFATFTPLSPLQPTPFQFVPPTRVPTAIPTFTPLPIPTSTPAPTLTPIPSNTPVPNVDTDGDGIFDTNDNCPAISNPGQADFNNDGVGDVCQDTDGDSVMDVNDLCPVEFGDAGNSGCPLPTETATTAPTNTSVPTETPTTPPTETPTTAPVDSDGDGVEDASDNCPSVSNPGQADFNSNGTGDACEDSDGDTVLDVDDACPDVAGEVGNNGCPLIDTDGDGIPDASDNCPAVSNPGQADFNSNGVGDVCEDSDGDTVMDDADLCPAQAGDPANNGCP